MGSAELYFPFPGLQKDKSVRLSTFFDIGTVGDTSLNTYLSSSAGLALSWFSPVGPLKISLARALRVGPGDRTQPFQFSVGTVF